MNTSILLASILNDLKPLVEVTKKLSLRGSNSITTRYAQYLDSLQNKILVIVQNPSVENTSDPLLIHNTLVSQNSVSQVAATLFVANFKNRIKQIKTLDKKNTDSVALEYKAPEFK